MIKKMFSILFLVYCALFSYNVYAQCNAIMEEIRNYNSDNDIELICFPFEELKKLRLYLVWRQEERNSTTENFHHLRIFFNNHKILKNILKNNQEEYTLLIKAIPNGNGNEHSSLLYLIPIKRINTDVPSIKSELPILSMKLGAGSFEQFNELYNSNIDDNFPISANLNPRLPLYLKNIYNRFIDGRQLTLNFENGRAYPETIRREGNDTLTFSTNTESFYKLNYISAQIDNNYFIFIKIDPYDILSNKEIAINSFNIFRRICNGNPLNLTNVNGNEYCYTLENQFNNSGYNIYNPDIVFEINNVVLSIVKRMQEIEGDKQEVQFYINVLGHSDAIGNEEINHELRIERAKNVAERIENVLRISFPEYFEKVRGSIYAKEDTSITERTATIKLHYEEN